MSTRSATRAVSPVAAGQRKPFPLFPLYAFWVLMTFEVDQFASAMVGGPFYRLPLLLLPVLAVAILSRGDKRAAYWPLIVFVTMHLGASIFAENTGLARDAFKFMLYMLLLFATTVSLLDTPPKMIVVLKIYLLHFIWFGVQGIPSGLVSWHPLLSNEDSYGPLMVMAIPVGFFFGLAAASPSWRWVGRGTFLLGVLGLVVSFARGAAITAGAVLVFIILRSPRPGRALIGLLLAALVLVPVAAMVVPLDQYIAELQSSSEGDEGRLAVWGIAYNVFRHSPIVGVGAFNFGPIASQITEPDPERAKGADPSQIYSLWTHNAPMQILAEEGLIGIVVWLVMLLGFVRRTARLRRPASQARWLARGGKEFDLKAVSLALDGAMLGWLGCSIFYNQLYVHWFWSLITMSYALAVIVDRASEGSGGKVSGS
jgi:O-antigen ligase